MLLSCLFIQTTLRPPTNHPTERQNAGLSHYSDEKRYFLACQE